MTRTPDLPDNMSVLVIDRDALARQLEFLIEHLNQLDPEGITEMGQRMNLPADVTEYAIKRYLMMTEVKEFLEAVVAAFPLTDQGVPMVTIAAPRSDEMDEFIEFMDELATDDARTMN